MNCTLCDTPLTNHVDKFYFACGTCGAYVKDQGYYVTHQQEKSRYEEHNNDVNDERYQNFTSPITDAILEKYTAAHLGLDYGCGTAPVISKKLLDKGYQVKLFDPYFHPDEDYLNHQYDYIFSCEVFEHFHRPQQEIQKLLDLLKHNGLLLIMTHLYDSSIDFKNWYYRKDDTHVFIYTRKTFEFIAARYNLTVERQNNRLIFLKKTT